MADLSLADALTEPPPEIEEEIKRDFIATLEAEAFDDVVGETVGKTDYIPLLDVDEKTGNSESKKKSCSDASQSEGSPASKSTVLANGDHGIEGNNITGSPTEFLEEKMAYQDYQNNQSSPEDTNLGFQPQQVLNPNQIDPFKTHHDGDLEDLLLLSSGPTNASTFTGQNDLLEDSYAVVDQEWSVEALSSPHSESLVSPETIIETPQLTAEVVKEVEMESVEEQPPTKGREIKMEQMTTDIPASGEAETSPAMDVMPGTETEVALAKDKEEPIELDLTWSKDIQPSIESDMFPAKDTVLPIGTEITPVNDVILPTEADMSSAKDVVLPTETEMVPGKDVTLSKETERTLPVTMDLGPLEDMVPPKETETAPAKDVVSLAEVEVALTGDTALPEEMSSAEEMALSSETEAVSERDMSLPSDTMMFFSSDDVSLPLETEGALGKDVTPSLKTEMTLDKHMTPPPEPKLDLVEGMSPPPETELALVKEGVTLPETKVAELTTLTEKDAASIKDMPPTPEMEVALAKQTTLPTGTDLTLDSSVTPAKDSTPPSETEVAPVLIKDGEIEQGQEGVSEDSRVDCLQHEEQLASPPLISPEPVKIPSQKYSLPTGEDSVLEKVEQKEPFGSQPSEHSSETSGTPLIGGKQVCRPSDRRSAWSQPARAPPEQPGGSAPWKTLDPRLGPCPFSELGWVTGSFSYGDPGNQRKSTHTDFRVPQRDCVRESCNIESVPMMIKKKKKKPKQKKYPPSHTGESWNVTNADEPKGHPFPAGPHKSGVSSNQPTTMSTNHGLVSRDNLKSDSVVDSESLRVASCLEQPPKAAVYSQSKLREEEGKGHKSVSESQDKKLLQQKEHKPQPASCLKTSVDTSETEDTSVLKGSLTDIIAHKVETPLEARPKEDCSPTLGQEIVNGVSKPITEKVSPNMTPPSKASNLFDDNLKEGNNENKIKLQNVKDQKETSEGVKEVPKQREELGTEPFKKIASDCKNKKGRGSFGKVRAGSGKLRAKSETPILLDSEKDRRAVLRPEEPVPEGMAAEQKKAELGLDSSKQPVATTDLTQAVVVREAKEMADSEVGSPTQVLIPLGTASSLTPPPDARTGGGAEVKNTGISNQSKDGTCPWMGHESTPWISEKPKKRSNEGKSKKFKNNYPIQPPRMDGKEEILNPSFVEKDSDTGAMPHKNRELGPIFPQIHDTLNSPISDTPTMKVFDRKGENIEFNSVELGVHGGSKTNTVKESTIIEPVSTMTGTNCQDQVQDTGFVPSVVSEENKTSAAKGYTSVGDKPSKRSNDGKRKKVKNSFSENILEKADTTKIHIPMETMGDRTVEGIGYVDENRNITFTCPRPPSGLMNKSDPLEAVQTEGCKKLPIPTNPVVEEGDSFSDTSVKSNQERAPAQIAKVVEDTCNKDGVPGQKRGEIPAVSPSTTTEGVAVTLAAATENISCHRDPCLKDKGEIADFRKNEIRIINEGHETGESELVHHGASEHSVQQTTEPAKDYSLPGAPAEDQSLPEKAREDRDDLPAYAVNKEKRIEKGCVPAQNLDLLGDKSQKLSLCEDQNMKDRDFKGPDNLREKVEVIHLPSENEKEKSNSVSVNSKATKLECIPKLTSELQSSVSCGSVEVPPSAVEVQLVMTSKNLQCTELKDNTVESPQKMTEKSESKTLDDRKKEDKSRMTEPIKGYMRPTKSRGLPPLLPKSTSQEREKSKQLKSSGMNLPWKSVCACGLESESKKHKVCA